MVKHAERERLVRKIGVLAKECGLDAVPSQCSCLFGSATAATNGQEETAKITLRRDESFSNFGNTLCCPFGRREPCTMFVLWGVDPVTPDYLLL